MSLSSRSTGLPCNIWIGPRGHDRHAARIKVQQDHRKRFARDNLAVVSVEDDPPLVIVGRLLPKDLARVRRYIAANRQAILDHWREKTDSIELAQQLVRVP